MQQSGGRERPLKLRAVALAGLSVLLLTGEPATAAASTPPPPGPYSAIPVTVYPTPGDRYETPSTQIVFRGIAPQDITGVSVIGSKSGFHTGQLLPDADGAGGSFVPTLPFRSGEKVTVTTDLDVIGGNAGTFSFTIERPGPGLTGEPLPHATAANDVQHFHSRPDLQPAAIRVTKDSEPASDGDIFIAPQFGPNQDGPMILDPHGNLVWFQGLPLADRVLVTDFRVQQLGDQPVLTWWQGNTNSGSGRGVGEIYSRDYQPIATVHAGNGLQMDLHEFLLTNSGDAYVIAVSPIRMPGYARTIQNSVVQEIEVKTGLVLYQWDALDHLSFGDSYTFGPKESGRVLDPFHLNSVSLDPSGNVVVSARNTNAVYDVNRGTGAIIWELGGKHTSFKLGSGVATAFQHDAVIHGDNQLTIFDDGAGPPKVHPNSRGIAVSLNPAKKTATLLHQYTHSPQLSAAFEGSVQQLPSGDVFLGWGQQPYFSEVNSRGQQDFDAHFVAPTASYRAYRFGWSAQPPTLPALAVGATSGGQTTLWESWNGATDVSAWRVLAGPSPSKLAPIARYAKYRFESALTPGVGDAYVAVQALGSAGQVLATSPTRAVPNHTQIAGNTAFVSPSALGGLPVGCYSATACHISATLRSGSTVLARTGSQYYAPRTGGLLYFRLSPSARAMLASSSANRLVAQATTRDSSGAAAASRQVTLIGFSTNGSGPKYSAAAPATLQFRSGTAFVATNGIGAQLVECLADTPCQVKATVAAGGATIAATGTEYISAHQLGYIYFTLSRAGQAALSRASGNQLPVKVSVNGAGSSASATVALVGFH
jgi:hypothetical protein